MRARHLNSARLRVIALALAALASLVWAIVPIGGSTVVQENGESTLVVLAVPIVIALLPLLWRGRATLIVGATLLTAFALISGFTIGDLYLPAAAALWLEVWAWRPRKG